MARNEIVTVELIDDLDGSAAIETIDFSIDGRSYEIDLNKRNATSMRRAFKRYVDAGRSTRGGRRGPGRRTGSARRTGKTLFSRLDTEEKDRFRTWGVRQKLTTKTARRIADSAVEAWIEAGRP